MKYKHMMLRVCSGSIHIYDAAYRDIDIIRESINNIGVKCENRFVVMRTDINETHEFLFSEVVEVNELTHDEWIDIDTRGILPRSCCSDNICNVEELNELETTKSK
jgi:hypothetical protein